MYVLPPEGCVTVTLHGVEKITPIESLGDKQLYQLLRLLNNRITDFKGEAREVAEIEVLCSRDEEYARVFVAYRPDMNPMEIFPEPPKPFLG